jgi:transcriptional regulator with XRE-family HTH domain
MLSRLIERSYRGDRKKILRAVGISATALSQYTRGHTRPSFDKLVSLADFFGVSLDYLVFGEPVSVAPDHGPLVRYVDHALGEVQARIERKADVATRIGRVLGDRIGEQINNIAKELVGSNTAGREGLIQLDEVIRIEGYCRQADIIALHLGFDVIQMEDGDGAAAGQFLSVVAANVQKGCRYRFLLPGDSDQREAVSAFRELLTSFAGPDYAHECCAFRQAAQPLVSGAGLYRLNGGALERENEMLYAQFQEYISEDEWLGYLIRPNRSSNADMLMSRGHAAAARNAFEVAWAKSAPL